MPVLMKLELPDLLGHALICVSFCVSEIVRLPAAERLSVARRLQASLGSLFRRIIRSFGFASF